MFSTNKLWELFRDKKNIIGVVVIITAYKERSTKEITW